jgi:hypothetical protein
MDHQEHKRQVQSAMLNVYSDGQIAAFVAAGLKFQEEMQLYCLQRVEVSRVTKQLVVASLQKFLNATFFSSNGCTAEHRCTRDFIVIALRLSINVWLFGAVHIGFEGAASILYRWKNDDGSCQPGQAMPRWLAGDLANIDSIFPTAEFWRWVHVSIRAKPHHRLACSRLPQ